MLDKDDQLPVIRVLIAKVGLDGHDRGVAQLGGIENQPPVLPREKWPGAFSQRFSPRTQFRFDQNGRIMLVFV